MHQQIPDTRLLATLYDDGSDKERGSEQEEGDADSVHESVEGESGERHVSFDQDALARCQPYFIPIVA